MATKTLACPECGSEAAPGRYACTECGALLNGVAVRPRLPAPQPVATNGSKPRSKSGSGSASRPPSGHVPLLDAEPEPESELERFAPALPPAVPSTFGSVAAPHETLIDDPSHDWDPIALDDELEPAEQDVVAPEATSSLQVETGAEPSPDLHEEPRSEVAWPPPGDRGPLAAPEPRTPAGMYLPPSAVLPPLDAPLGASAGAASAAASAAVTGSPSAASSLTAGSRDWLAALGPPDRRWDASRRTIAIGAAVAALGFILPWANVSISAIVANWFDLWGLAGGGHWLLVLGLAALGGVAASAGRTVSWPLGVPAIGSGTLLLGLVWPYVFGSFNRPFGVLVVLVGAIVLVVGGAIQLTARHEAATPVV